MVGGLTCHLSWFISSDLLFSFNERGLHEVDIGIGFDGECCVVVNGL